jgi:tetratricopeptide (TPR) repeat protein
VDLLLDAAAGARMTPDAIVSMLTALVERDGRSIPVRLALSRVRAATGNAAQAMADAQAAAAIDSADPRPLEQAASILADVQEVERLRIVVRELEGRRPTAARTLYYAATLAFLEERFAQAESLAARSVAADPAEAKAHNLLGAARASQGLAAEAEQAFLQARRTDPREPSTYMNLGQLALQRGDTAGAVSRFAEALELDPVSEGARTALADALQRAGEHERAVRVRASGRAQ